MAIHLVCDLTDEIGWGGRVAIGHGNKYSCLPPAQLAALGRRLADSGVAVSVLPATDLFTSGRHLEHSVIRGVADANALLAEGARHLALDPEFAWGPGVTPVEDIGHLTAAQVNETQAMLQGIAHENGLPGKILIVHQFRYSMLPDKSAIGAYDGVELVIDMDGFGPPAAKLATYDAVITRDAVQYPGAKLFYEHDVPLMSPADVLSLQPRPVVVIYQ